MDFLHKGHPGMLRCASGKAEPVMAWYKSRDKEQSRKSLTMSNYSQVTTKGTTVPIEIPFRHLQKIRMDLFFVRINGT